MTKKKNITQSITLRIHELMRLSMECLSLGVFSEGLHSDLLILLLQFLSHTGVGQVIRVGELKDYCDGTQSQWLY